ncbi:MAG: exopolyphosphatase, partial [Acidobacteria bacterium]|nr:exopolyphosphatase [Acidobacteriota bacterium]
PVERRFRSGAGWRVAVGSSGTVRSVAEVVQEAGWCEEGITLQALLRLRELLIERGSTTRGGIKGLSEGRAPVFAGGVAVLLAVFKALRIERMRVAGGALREGALYDLLGRLHHEDTRHAAVESMARRYHVQPEQAERVRETALQLLEQCAEPWNLTGELPWLMLSWGAQLHEVGLDINHAGFHKHGAYIVENAEMHGFSLQEHLLLASLVRSHRRKFPRQIFDRLPSGWRQPARRGAVLLRLAAVLHRSRRDEPLAVKLEVDGRDLKLVLPRAWLETSPLTRADLRQEAKFLAAAKYRLTVEEDG